MEEMPQVPDDVQRFLNIATNIVASHNAKWFKYDVNGLLRTYQIHSPIEQLLFTAMWTMVKAWNIQNLGINPQHVIGPYKVDFFSAKSRLWDRRDKKSCRGM